MTSSADFKQAIRSGKISEAFLIAMSNIPELQITTKIITDRPEGSDRSTPETDNYLQTHISLIEGKIENEIGEKFTGDRYREIEQFHLEQVTQAHQTIQQNLMSLQQMFQLMSAFQQQVLEHPNWVNLATNTSPALSTEPKPSRLHGNSAKVLKAKIGEKASPHAASSPKSNSLEPQLPAFNYDSFDDLLSMNDADLGSETDLVREDWSEWLDEEDEVKTTVFEFKTFKEPQDKDCHERTLDKQERSPEKTLVD